MMSSPKKSTKDEEFNFSQWKYGKCIYKCEICDKTFGYSNVFWHHVDADHNLVPKEYKTRHKNYLFHKEVIKCLLCDNEILHDFGKMKLHLDKTHYKQFTLKEYFDCFLDPNPERISDGYQELPDISEKNSSQKETRCSNSILPNKQRDSILTQPATKKRKRGRPPKKDTILIQSKLSWKPKSWNIPKKPVQLTAPSQTPQKVSKTPAPFKSPVLSKRSLKRSDSSSSSKSSKKFKKSNSESNILKVANSPRESLRIIPVSATKIKVGISPAKPAALKVSNEVKKLFKSDEMFKAIEAKKPDRLVKTENVNAQNKCPRSESKAAQDSTCSRSESRKRSPAKAFSFMVKQL